MASNIFVCVPCAIDHIDIQASVWCRECQETLCDSCNKQHKRVNVCKNHYTIAVDILPSKEVLKSLSSNQCPEHTNSSAVLYCLDHDEPCCSKCLVQNAKHNKCKNESIQEASKNVKHSTILSCISNDIEDMHITLSQLNSSTDLNLQNIDSNCKDIISKFTSMKENIITKLDECENKLVKELKLQQEEVVAKVMHQNERANKVMNAIEKCSTELEFAKSHGSNEQILLHAFKVQKTIKACSDDLEQVALTSNVYNLEIEGFQNDLAELVEPPVSISISQSTIVHKARNLLQAQFVSIGSVQPILSKFTLSESLQLNKVHQRSIGVVLSEDEHIILYNDSSTSILKCSATLERIASCRMKGTYTAIVSLSGRKRIYFVNLRTMHKQEKSISLPDVIGGIHATADKILAGSASRLYLLNHNGQILSTFEAINATKWNAIRYVRLCENDTILYSDSKAVYVYSLDQQNKCLYTCTDTLDSGIEDIEIDTEGNIYVLLPGKSEVITMSSTKPEQTFLGEKDGLSYPKAMCFNTTCNTLLVVNSSGLHLSIFKKEFS
ncbi:Hypothetical predicted protein [Mytilus galloprovincialis]|uniref:B box-type domain-containing protein n=1 Tax=Mytilus galloprovincialis TaxID=29158 RepID=A0A8B6HLU7_MYTGA|nr:Hypothetical predicted protein [Mytilus galloprovincialis]